MSNMNFSKEQTLKNGYDIVLVGAATALPSTTPQNGRETARVPDHRVGGLRAKPEYCRRDLFSAGERRGHIIRLPRAKKSIDSA